ncbi:MAG: hypothetical protein GXY26_02490 [Clostridiales bacterium]|nr:hypothetical protein [Clostridiales bacterium]
MKEQLVRTVPKTTLSMAVMYYGTDLIDRIIEFNRSSATCRIELKDYSVYNIALQQSSE